MFSVGVLRGCVFETFLRGSTVLKSPSECVLCVVYNIMWCLSFRVEVRVPVLNDRIRFTFVVDIHIG